MNSKFLLLTRACAGHLSGGHVLFIAFLFVSLLLEEGILRLAVPGGNTLGVPVKLGRRSLGAIYVPRSADMPLRGLKYLLLGIFLFVIGAMSAEALQGFMETPYGLVADVKMLKFFRDIGLTAAVVVGLLVLLSKLVHRTLVPLPVPLRRQELRCSLCSAAPIIETGANTPPEVGTQ